MSTKKPPVVKKVVFTTELVEKTTERINDGEKVQRFENPWFKNEIGVRRSGVTFKLSDDEIQEYIRCKLDIHYFAEKYCKVKTEDGSIRNITLRDYQKDILDLYTNNRFSILMGSRQIGKCFSFNTLVNIENLGLISIGNLYYSIVSSFRKLTFIEKVKIRIYNLIYLLENINQFDRKP
jgi:hypothetical protein